MNTTQAQQKSLDDALVTHADRLEFGKCNMPLKTDIKPKEATFQVVLDALTLTPFYQAFLITAEVPAIYMQEFWATVTVHKSSIRFTINKKKFFLDVKVENKDAKKTNKMLYPRFIKVIIDYFMTKDQSISRRNKMFWYTARDDTLFTSMRCVSIQEKTQVYGVILPQHLTNQKDESDTSPKKKTTPASKGSKLKSPAKVAKTDKKKKPAMIPKTKGLAVLSEVRDEQQQKVSGTNKGAGVRPEVPDVPKYDSKSDEESWTFSQDEEDADEVTYVNDDSDEIELDNIGDDLSHPNLSTYKVDDEEEEQEKADDEEMYSDQRVSTPLEYELTEEEENKEGDDKDKEGEHEQDDEDDLYRDVNINLEKSDAEMTDAQANKDTEDAHVTLTAVPQIVQQQSSFVSSYLVSKFINHSSDIGIDSILNLNIQSHTLVNVPVFVTAETPSSDTTIHPPPIPTNQPL
ncbi:hypothetical protein Tco_1265397 [Tanacetum coccineum]